MGVGGFQGVDGAYSHKINEYKKRGEQEKETHGYQQRKHGGNTGSRRGGVGLEISANGRTSPPSFDACRWRWWEAGVIIG